MSDIEHKDCSCESCVSACRYKPGWFMPGEAEKAADLLNMELPDFFKQYLGVDWWTNRDSEQVVEGQQGEIFVLAPATLNMDSGDMYPGNPRGQCIFLKGGRCSIHSVKPFECRRYMHDEDDQSIRDRHIEIVKAWSSHQPQVTELLGREPESEDMHSSGLGGLFSIMFD